MRCEISGRAELGRKVSDRFGEFGGRRGDPQCGAGLDCEFVVAAAQIPQEGVAGDHHLRGPIRSSAAHRSQPVLELAVISFYRVVRRSPGERGENRAASASSGVHRCTRR